MPFSYTSTRLVMVVTWAILYSVVCSWQVLAARIAPGQDQEDIPFTVQRCDEEKGTGSTQHEDWISRLDGKKIVFIGDSITRYQYLSLAFYLAHGLCPSKNSTHGYIVSEKGYNSWPEFFRNSTDALIVDGEHHLTHAQCFCDRTTAADENRYFVYQDDQGRTVEVVYLQYFREDFHKLSERIQMVAVMAPTDVLVTYSTWMPKESPSCGSTAKDLCPPISWVCKYLKKEHPYRVWWLSGTPRVKDGEMTVIMPNFMNVPVRCKLDSKTVLDRVAVVDELQPDAQKQPELYWDVNAHGIHFHANASHAFNAQFLSRLPKPSSMTAAEATKGVQRRVWRPSAGGTKLET